MVRFNDLSTKQKGSKEDRFDVLAAEIELAETGESSISEDVATLKTTVGKASGDGAGGLAKDMVDVKAAIGDAQTADTLVYDVADVKTYIAEILTANSLTDPRAQNGDG